MITNDRKKIQLVLYAFGISAGVAVGLWFLWTVLKMAGGG